MNRAFLCIAAAGALLLACAVARQQPQPQPQQRPSDLGFTDTPMLPGQPWHVHDPARPHPRRIAPADTPGGAPSDALVLFDGKDLSHWTNAAATNATAGAAKPAEARWKLGDGYFEVVRGTGNLRTREAFGDCQLHVEWASPAEVHGNSQSRGNSGVLLMGRYEVQVLDAWNNPTYADGQAAALYGQWPPLVNPARQPGQWNTYDIVFEAPLFDGDKLVKPAYATVFYNGVLVHHRRELLGPMVNRQVAHYTPHGPVEPLELQDHHDPVRYRNIWIRRVGSYDEPEKTR